jgi:EAL domain-containing protein (putative c-di-GMP-specific phosphodiesterase class I)
LGVKLAIDDFGTGYSSLSYLKSFPIDILKIAKSFVDGVGAASEESALARAIIKLGGTLRLQTVAEGVELPEQRDQLRDLDCNMGQGYYFARPLDHTDMDDLLAADGLGEWPPIEDPAPFPVEFYTAVPHAV